MRHLRLIPDNTKIRFMRLRRYTFPLSGVLSIVSCLLFATMGFNYGIDFRGGTLMEILTPEAKADLGAIRTKLVGLGLGDVQMQEFGAPNDVLIRIQQQPGGDAAQQAVIQKIKGALGDAVTYRRIEVVGPRISGEFVQRGTIAVVLSIVVVLVYLWFRFEWQFAIGATAATMHDIVLTIGMFAGLQLDFDLSSIAAILTIVGYSLNDTVVVYDRIRENLRRYKRMPLPQLLDLSINETLSRTTLTSLTTLIALVSLYLFGGEVIRSFTLAMIFGVIVGTYSSIYIAAPFLIYMNLRPSTVVEEMPEKEAPAGSRA